MEKFLKLVLAVVLVGGILFSSNIASADGKKGAEKKLVLAFSIEIIEACILDEKFPTLSVSVSNSCRENKIVDVVCRTASFRNDAGEIIPGNIVAKNEDVEVFAEEGVTPISKQLEGGDVGSIFCAVSKSKCLTMTIEIRECDGGYRAFTVSENNGKVRKKNDDDDSGD